jgi:Tol biopolymer transport system component
MIPVAWGARHRSRNAAERIRSLARPFQIPDKPLSKGSRSANSIRPTVRRLAAITLILCAAPAATGDAARQSSQGRIVFASERGSTLENSELFSVRADGSRRRALSRNPKGGDSGGRWSTDRTRIAFVSERLERGHRVDGLYVMRMDGRRLRRLTPRWFEVAIDVVPDWSPDGAELTLSGKRGSRSGVWTIHADGRRLRFLARGTDAAWSPSGDRIVFTALNGISVVSAAGGRVRRLTHGPNDSTPAWSPDGRTLAFVRSDADGVVQQLALVPAAGGAVRRIFGGRDADIGRTPQWSPSGRLLAVLAYSSVYVVRVRDRAATRLRRRADWPAWSPDGRRIAFTSGSSIFVMNADGSGVRRVRTENGSEFDDGPHWSPDGKVLSYSTVLLRSDFEIFSVRPDGSDLKQLTHNSAQDWMPAWSRSRRRIAFVRRGWIWLMRADGSGARRLFQGGQPSWSPNGAELAYSTTRGVVVRRLDHRPATRVADGFSPAWSPNGAEIAFVNGTQLRAVARASGAERTIIDLASSCPVGNEMSVYRPDWSPDGRRLAFVVVCDDGRFFAASANIVNADGSGLRDLPIESVDAARVAWSPDGARLVFVSEDPSSRLGTIKPNGSGRAAVIHDDAGAAYADPDW